MRITGDYVEYTAAEITPEPNTTDWAEQSRRGFAPSKDVVQKCQGMCSDLHRMVSRYRDRFARIHGEMHAGKAPPEVKHALGKMLTDQFLWMTSHVPITVWGRTIWDMALSGHEQFTGYEVTTPDVQAVTPSIWTWQHPLSLPANDDRLPFPFPTIQAMTIVYSTKNIRALGMPANTDIIHNVLRRRYPDAPSDAIICITVYVPNSMGMAAADANYRLPLDDCIPRMIFHPMQHNGSIVTEGSANTMAAIKFLLSRVAGVESLHLNRAEIRQQQREQAKGHAKQPETKYILLRRLERKAHEDGANGEGRSEYNCQFMVNGFWRQQPCGPRNSERRLTYIAPFLKGPEGAPMLPPKQTLYFAKR